jgi:hypothetical protein
MYAEKYDGIWPPVVDTTATQNRWPVPFHLGGIITANYGLYDTAGMELRRPDPSIFICPAERAERMIPSWNGSTPTKPVDRVEVGGSYSINGEYHRTPDGYLTYLGTGTDPLYTAKVDNLRRTADVFVIMDNFRPLESTSTPWRFHRGAQQNPRGSDNFQVQSGGFWTGYHLYDGTPVSPSEAVDKLKIIGGRHSGSGNGLCADTHVENYIPDKIPYNRVSWLRWPHSDKTPPGGL